MREAFTDWNPTAHNSKALLGHAVRLTEEYMAQGYQLTVRQLYYQLVQRGTIPNEQKWYKRLVDIVTRGRMAGWIDWDAIVDRGRRPVIPAAWSSPAEILEAAVRSYRVDRWEGQDQYVEVWVEKDALMGILEPVCAREHVRVLACRGYASATAVYDSSKRLLDALDRGKYPCILYLGDHDPSGLDMTRDIDERVALMVADFVEIDRLALNMDQVQSESPVPNPTKLSDSRAPSYIMQFGHDSWELDALDPPTLTTIIETAIEGRRDNDLWEEMMEKEELHREQIRAAIAGMK